MEEAVHIGGLSTTQPRSSRPEKEILRGGKKSEENQKVQQRGKHMAEKKGEDGVPISKLEHLFLNQEGKGPFTGGGVSKGGGGPAFRENCGKRNEIPKVRVEGRCASLGHNRRGKRFISRRGERR